MYVEPKKKDPNDPTNMIYCNPYEAGCSYILSVDAAERENTAPMSNDNILEIDLSDDTNPEKILCKI